MRRLLVALAALTVLFGVAGSARADGDPASDALLYSNAYLPYAAPSKAASTSLAKEIAAAYAAGYRVKVAVIQSRTDLGAIPSLFGKPPAYASFLGQEISGIYVGPLLIVMPAGYGIYDGGRSTAAEQNVLGGLPSPGKSPDELAGAAGGAVAKLLRAGALKSKDVLKPFTQPLQARLRGHVLTALFYLYDDSGKASATVTVKRAGRVLVTSQLASRATSVLHPESTTLTVPSSFSLAHTSLCVTAVDPSGNRATACKKL